MCVLIKTQLDQTGKINGEIKTTKKYYYYYYMFYYLGHHIKYQHVPVTFIVRGRFAPCSGRVTMSFEFCTLTS